MRRYYTWAPTGADPGAKSQFNYSMDDRVPDGAARAFPTEAELVENLLTLATEPGAIDGAEWIELEGDPSTLVVPPAAHHVTGVFLGSFRVGARRPLKGELERIAAAGAAGSEEARDVLFMRAMTEGEELPE
ncbi:hypothetical protein ENSA5_11800 [Enhygromyxa salina]|uniref:Uncharacterized protein n=1 Tax=Enhygromyxa salina TaxID=215803 RepID=A0A2S9YFW8_9BACT|nr:hypothetical protein [Enhygromyxa salina]PRQ03997.1 hypothetical protein ENSA5_11800 [Enhygromyxa salina]